MSNKPVDYGTAYAALEKLGKLLTPLQPHQERVKQRIQDQPGLVVAHGLGTGKTLASIASADALNMPTTVVVPAALQANYLKELQAHRAEGADNFNITSLQKATRSQSLPDLKDQLLIVDEAHKLREPATKAHQYFKKLNPAKRMYLTASPVYNHPSDLASLVNLAAGSKVLPNTRNDFESTFTKMEKIRPSFWGRLRGVKPGERQVLQNIPQLKDVLHKWVDYHENKDTGDFPTSSEKIIHVPMSEKQQEVQDALLDKAPPWVRYKIKNNLPPSKQEKQLINSFLTTQRQLASSPQAFSHGMTTEEAVKHSPKLQLAVKNLMARMNENPNHKAVIYSNYLESGLTPYKHLLEQNKVPYGMFTGAMKKPEREQLVRDYNDNKIKALLLSTAGAEGLDLKGTRQIQLLDPHFNEEKMRQIIGRGVRYKSHSHLPEEERNVAVERYLAQNRPGFLKRIFGGRPDTSSEEYLHQLSQDKLKLNDQVVQLLREQDAEGMPKAASHKTAAPTRTVQFKQEFTVPLGALTYVFGQNEEHGAAMHSFIEPRSDTQIAYVTLRRSVKGPLHVTSMYVDPHYRGAGIGKELWSFVKEIHHGQAILAKPDPIIDKPHGKATLGKIYESYGLTKSPLHNNLFYINTPKAKTEGMPKAASLGLSHLNPYLRKAVIGAGIGSVGGAGLGALYANRQDDSPGYAKSMATGAAGGALLGGLAGLLHARVRPSNAAPTGSGGMPPTPTNGGPGSAGTFDITPGEYDAVVVPSVRDRDRDYGPFGQLQGTKKGVRVDWSHEGPGINDGGWDINSHPNELHELPAKDVVGRQLRVTPYFHVTQNGIPVNIPDHLRVDPTHLEDVELRRELGDMLRKAVKPGGVHYDWETRVDPDKFPKRKVRLINDPFTKKKAEYAAEHTPQEPTHLRDYALHSALNAGQAARDVRYLFDHPSADKIAPRDSALHSLSSLTARLPSLTSNAYYAALPPQLHHTPEELAEHRDASLKQMFLHGYAPWDNPLPENKTAADYAPGIPDRHYHAPLPDIKKPLTWKMSLQEHHADRAGHHYDLRLIDPETGHAHSWALPAAHMPEPGKSVLALQQPTHTSEYALNFGKDKEQEITKGYGKGRVKIKALDEIEVYHSKPEATGTRVRFNIYKSTGPEEYAIVNTGPGKDRLVNKTYHKERLEHLSLGEKPKTKELGLESIDFKNDNEVMMPKYDGAHTLLDLNTEGKIPRLFSYRTPKRHTAGVIEHTHKVPSLLEMRVPKELKGTVLRTETIGVDSKGKAVPAKDIAGMLNATVPNSRARQTELGTTLKPIILDVERYKGKSVQHLPFKERYELAKSIGKQMNLQVTDAAYDAKTKRKLLKLIGSGKHLMTTEGVVLRPLHQVGSPTKAKFRPDHDVHVREIFGATGKDGMALDRAGGFRYSHTPNGPIVGSVGTGFDHALLKDMLSNPHNYTGRVAKVQAEQKYESGALGKASFVEWHLDKGKQL